jgi:hypothetical protein
METGTMSNLKLNEQEERYIELVVERALSKTVETLRLEVQAALAEHKVRCALERDNAMMKIGMKAVLILFGGGVAGGASFNLFKAVGVAILGALHGGTK